VAQENPFSITLAFTHLDIPEFPRALEIARQSRSFRQTGDGARTRYHARFLVADAGRLLDVFNVVSASPDTEILIDDQEVPYARELWIPLVSFFAAS
jgi:hypothetical protein